MYLNEFFNILSLNYVLLYQSNDGSSLLANIISVALISAVFGIGSLIFNAIKATNEKITSVPIKDEKIIAEELSKKDLPKNTIFKIAPEIKSKKSIIESSLFKDKIRKIELEFVDGVKGYIFQNQTKNEYYIKSEEINGIILQYKYTNYTSCVDALYFYSTKKEILQVDFIDSFSKSKT